MCPLTRLVHSLNDCFDDRTHWYTLSLSYHQIFLTEQKNNTKNWQQQSNDQISKVFFSFQRSRKIAKCIHSVPFNSLPPHSHTLSPPRKRRKTKNFQVIIQCNAIFIAVTTRFKRVLKPFLLLLFFVFQFIRESLAFGNVINWMLDGCCAVYICDSATVSVLCGLVLLCLLFFAAFILVRLLDDQCVVYVNFQHPWFFLNETVVKKSNFNTIHTQRDSHTNR